ncbi:hypothetical protein HZH68_014952 [Vespula germanica]|uniref:Fatty acid 2-hydroxylase n=1 Tax=Vespula germanica TaxID=30212 RepID=A0A834MU59_VESGE|nr:hypothetical protein HZH68_014952 [Vespula germanica]
MCVTGVLTLSNLCELKNTVNIISHDHNSVKLRNINSFQSGDDVIDDDAIAKSSQDERRRFISDDETEKEDKFIVKYKGRIYDIRAFLNNHPGGRKTLSSYKEKNLDRVLKEYPHSDAALHLFNEYALDNKIKYDEVESLIDWNTPLLSQVGELSDRYWQWVNLPVNRPIRLFRSDILEFLTITPWYLIPIVWIPICAYFLYTGFSLSITRQFPKGLLAFAGGVLLWTFEEYLLHRKLFHFRPPGNSKILITLHFLLHGLHHKAPFDGQRLVFPPVAGVIIAVGIWNLYISIFPDFIANFISAGTVAGYLCYDLTHYYLHYGKPNAKTYFYDLKRYHNYHHFSHHDKGFGISNKIWDYVFNTSIRLQQLAKPIEW